ncbi:PspA/IM30 family protein [Serratia ficaria]|uniref:PspA/IM30 family protein n=1 Tax=Serratia ficaria TaxID=61651 RepID=UPI00218423E9|nr:PspA/IM30 family protein [Serratia ficaria]CAI2536182.1 Phage shock protein A homolog [Serratia ficaria]
MAIPIVRRILRMFKAQVNDTLDQVEDLGATARQMVRELDTQIANTEEAITSVIADQRLLEKKAQDALKETADWTERAEKAVLANRDDLAKAALKHVERHERNHAAYQSSLDVLSPKVTEIKTKLSQLREQRDDSANQASLFDARVKAADATSRISSILGGVGANPIDFSGIKDRVDQIEARASAKSELASGAGFGDFDAELEALKSTPVDERLADLKKRLNSSDKE